VFINSARESVWENIGFNNCTTTNKLDMVGHGKEIIYDKGASIHNGAGFGAANLTGDVTIVQAFPHIVQHDACNEAQTPGSWDGAAVCDSTATVRRVLIGNLEKDSEFDKVDMRAIMVTNDTHARDLTLTTSDYTSIVSYLGKLESKNRQKSFAMPYVMGSTYNLWWLTGLDFTTMSVFPSKYMLDGEDAVILRFNYTTSRELYDMYHDGTEVFNQTMTTMLDATTCAHGDIYNDEENRYFYICVGGSNGRTAITDDSVTLKANAIICRYNCPKPPGLEECPDADKKAFAWSNASAWTADAVRSKPENGESFTIDRCWTITVDENIVVGDLIIDGNLLYSGDTDLTLTANNIHVRNGEFNVGAHDKDYAGTLRIILNGGRFDETYIASDEVASSKSFISSGSTKIYAPVPAVTKTKLAETAFAGNTSMTLTDSVIGIWNVDDKLVIAPSFKAYD